jgi:DNA modification methylase
MDTISHSITPQKEATIEGKSIYYGKAYRKGFEAIIGTNDVLNFLDTMPEQCCQLIVTSPHYNMGKTHEKPLELDKYVEWQRTVIKLCVEKLEDNGSICWQAGNYVKDGETFPLDVYFYGIFKSLGLKLRNRLIWHFEHGLHSRQRFSGRYETILWFTKSDEYIFNLDGVRIPQKYPGKCAYKGANKGKPSGNPLGKNPSDVWKILINDWDSEIWNIPNVKANHPEKTIHPSQFPIELVERLVLALTNEGDTVFDPFAGSGSSIVAAVLNNRKAIGVDKDINYSNVSYDRVVAAINGTLKRRPINRPVWVPSGSEKVAMVPRDWRKPSS